MLEEGFLTQAYPAKTQRLSEGVFWFFIAATILLALLDAHIAAPAPQVFSVAWAGVFALYYALRLPLTQPYYHAVSHERSGLDGPRRLTGWRSRMVLVPLLDLLVISSLVALSGGWESPLSLLYLGWSVALLEVSSPLVRVLLSVLVCSAYALGVLLTLPQPFAPLQGLALAQQALVLVLVLLGVNVVKVSRGHTKYALEAERRQWDVLRQTVFAQLSHELYTPLSAIRASTTLLAAEETVSAQTREMLDVIARNCARMTLLIDDLLALWREPLRQFSYAPQRLECLAVARSIEQTLASLLEERQQRLLITAAPQDVGVLADRQRLEQVLVNLLENAHKYAPAGTAITLAISGQGHNTLFAIHDDGPGVPWDEQPQLFDMFYRGTTSLVSARGSGIGLALAKTLVVLQGGRIWVESLPGSGCTFFVLLPGADAKTPADPGESANAYLAG